MDILEAIQTRHSVRDFASRPLPKELVMKIMEVATRSPSGRNGQPWEIFIASGKAMETIRKRYQSRAQQPPAAPPASPPPPLPADVQERMEKIHQDRMKLLGLDPADPDSRKVLMEMGVRLYGAPVLAVICMHQAFSSNLDIGLLTQTICLAAHGLGVDTLIAGTSVSQPDILREELEIPPQLNIVIGVLLGYANPDHILNTYRSPRRPIEEVVRYKA